MDETTLRMFRDKTVVSMVQDATLAGAMPFACRLVRELARRHGRAAALKMLDFWDIPADVWDEAWAEAEERSTSDA